MLGSFGLMAQTQGLMAKCGPNDTPHSDFRRTTVKLYYFPPSTHSRKVQAIALHLNLPIEYQLINLQQGDQRTPEFLAINPTGRIPTLVDGDFSLWESTAIMQYLASQVSTDLWPENAELRADIARWQSWEMAHWVHGCQPVQFERFVKQVLQLGEPDEAVIERTLDTFHREAAVLNAHLSQQNYLVNNQLTLADFSVATHLTYAAVAQLPLEKYEPIQAWYARIEALPAWQETTPQG